MTRHTNRKRSQRERKLIDGILGRFLKARLKCTKVAKTLSCHSAEHSISGRFLAIEVTFHSTTSIVSSLTEVSNVAIIEEFT